MSLKLRGIYQRLSFFYHRCHL